MAPSAVLRTGFGDEGTVGVAAGCTSSALPVCTAARIPSCWALFLSSAPCGPARSARLRAASCSSSSSRACSILRLSIAFLKAMYSPANVSARLTACAGVESVASIVTTSELPSAVTTTLLRTPGPVSRPPRRRAVSAATTSSEASLTFVAACR